MGFLELNRMKYSDREKDKALASYYNGAACADDDLTAMLKDDGYIVTLTSPNGIVTRITDKGRAFYFNGGYVGAKRKERTKVIGDSLRSIIAAVVGSVLTILIEHVLLPWLASLQ